MILDILGARDPHATVLAHVVEEAIEGTLQLVTSQLSRVEVAFIEGQADYVGGTDLVKIDRFFDDGYVFMIEVHGKLIRIARDLVRKHRLTSHDAVHLASAIQLKCQRMFTADGTLLALKQCEGVKITLPKTDRILFPKKK